MTTTPSTAPSDARAPLGPEALRAEIEQTRAELGRTIEALAAKTDVKARARDSARRLRSRASQPVTMALVGAGATLVAILAYLAWRRRAA